MALRELQVMISAKDNLSRVAGDATLALNKIGYSISQVNKAMVGAGVAATAMGAVMLKAFGSVVSAAAEWETQMHEIWTLMEDEGKGSLDAVQNSLFELSARVPQSLGTLADGLYWIMSSGYKGAEAVQVLEQSAKLATATLTDTGAASDVLVKSLNAYAMGADEAQRVSDVLFRTIEIGIADMEELAVPWGAVIGMAGMTGVKLEELGAAFATLTRQGLNAALSGTAVRGMINSIIGPSETLKSRWQELYGTTIQNTLAQEGLAGVAAKVQQALNVEIGPLIEIAKVAGDDEEAFLAMAQAKGLVSERMKEMFPNLRGLIGFMGLLANDGKVWTMSLNEMYNSSGATERAFGKMMDTFAAKWQSVKNAFDRFKIAVGQGVLPVVTKIVQGIGWLVELFNKLPQGVKSFIGVLLGFGGVTLVIGGLVMLFKALGAIIGATLITFGPYVLAAIAIIGLLSLAVQWLKDNWEKIEPVVNKIKIIIIVALAAVRKWVIDTGRKIWDALGKAWERIKPTVLTILELIRSGVVMLWDALVSLWNQIKGPLAAAWNEFVRLGKALWDLLVQLWPVLKIIGIIILGVVVAGFLALVAAVKVAGVMIGKILLPVIRVVIWVFKALAKVIGWVVGFVIDAVGWIAKAFAAVWNAIIWALGKVGSFFKTVWNAIVKVFKWAWGAIRTAWNAVGKPIVNFIAKVWDVVKTIWGTIWKVITTVLKWYWFAISGLFVVIWRVLVAVASTIWDILVTVWQAVWRVISSVLGAIWDGIVAVWQFIFPPLKAVAETIWDTLVTIWQTVWSVITSVVSAVWNALVAVWNFIFPPLKAVAEAIWNTISSIWNGVWNGIKRVVSGVWNALVDVWNNIFMPIVRTAERVWDTLTGIWSGIWNGLKDAIAKVWNWIKDKISWITGALSKIKKIWPGHWIGGGDESHRGGMMTPYGTFHYGGEVGAILQVGEYVIKRESAIKMGKGVLDYMNSSGRVPTMVEPVMMGGGGTTYNIQHLEVYGVANVDEMFEEINRRANRASLRTQATRETW